MGAFLLLLFLDSGHHASNKHLYNCSKYAIDSVPLEERRHVTLGMILIALFAVCETLYVPCMVVIVRHLDKPCYKLLFAIGVLDMLCLWVCGLEVRCLLPQ